MYKEMLNKLEAIKDKFVDIEIVDNIFEAEGWNCMGYPESMDLITYIESPMTKQIDLHIVLDKEPLGWGELAPGTKIKIESVEKLYWED